MMWSCRDRAVLSQKEFLKLEREVWFGNLKVSSQILSFYVIGLFSSSTITQISTHLDLLLAKFLTESIWFQGRETTRLILNKKGSFIFMHGLSWIPRARTPGWPLERLKPGLSLCFSGTSSLFPSETSHFSLVESCKTSQLKGPSLTN